MEVSRNTRARFVACGFSQKEEIDYEETFSLVARYTSIRAILAIAAIKKWKVHQMDVKTSFLNGVIEEEVYVEQPKCFETHDSQTHVCRLKKALCRLKKEPRAWYDRIDNFLMILGFTNSKSYSNLYLKVVDGEPVIPLLYVVDLFLIGDEKLITESKRKLDAEFKMKYLGMMHYFLGLEVWKRLSEIFLNQGKYVVDILKRFRMMDCKDMPTLMVKNMKLLRNTSSEIVDATIYKQMIGWLMYLMNTRPDICFVMKSLSQYIVELRSVHLVAEKHVMRYLKSTIDYGLKYASDHEISLQGFANSDWVGSVVDQKSTYGCFFSMGSSVISWFCRKHTSVALSMVEAEYIAVCSTSSEVVWLWKLFAGLFDLELEATCIWCDNQSCVNLKENLVFHDNTNHVKIRYHYIRYMVQKGIVKLQYVTTDGKISDMLTKPLSRVKFMYFRDKLGVVQKDIPSKRE
jgi:hypothetical protein